MSERLSEIRRLIFNPEYGGFDPDESLTFASGVLKRKIRPSDLSALTPDEADVLVVVLRRQYPSSFAATIQAVIHG